MREIKFRAWDSIKKYMSNCAGIEWSSGKIVFRKWSGINLTCKEDALMQFIGLLDKNKKEIYEGYIVKVDGRICEVRWDEEWSGWSFVDDNMDTYRFESDMVLEVIGNKFENPELLK